MPKHAGVASLHKQRVDPQVKAEQYRQVRGHFLEQAREELATRDLPQASKKGRRTAAQMLEAIAKQRGWEHHRHRHYHRVANRLRSETGDTDIRR